MENPAEGPMRASYDKHYTALRALGKAILLTEEVLSKKNMDAIPFKSARELDETELELLSRAYTQMLEAAASLRKHPPKSYVPIELICSDETIVKYLAARHIVTVLDAWNYEPSALYGLINQCEMLGVKGQQHLYFLAQQ